MKPSLSISAGAVTQLCFWYAIDPLDSFFPFLLSMGLHELGHLLALVLTKTPIGAVRVSALGCSMQTGVMDYRTEFLCAAAGPLMNLSLLFLFRHRAPMLAFVNLCLTLFNLLPIWPLDGGRMLRSGLSALLPVSISERVEKTVSAAVCILLCCLAVYFTCFCHLGLWPVLLAGLLIIKTGGSRISEKQVANLVPSG